MFWLDHRFKSSQRPNSTIAALLSFLLKSSKCNDLCPQKNTKLNLLSIFSTQHKAAGAVLTDVVILSAGAELKAQGERREELELFGELERSVGRERPVALPSLEAFGGVIAGAVAVVVHHVEDVALGALVRHRGAVVRAEHVQVVVYAHVDVVVATVKPDRKWRRETVMRITGKDEFCFYR